MFIYRYMDFYDLYTLLNRGTLRFKKPYDWQDKYESILESIFTDSECYNIAFRTLCESVAPEEATRTMIRLYNLYNTHYVCCFTGEDNEDNDFMWRAFSFNREMVRVKFDFYEDKIDKNDVKIGNRYEEMHALILPVKYNEEINNIKQYIKLFKPEEIYKHANLLSYKRPYFKNEQEYRMIIAPALSTNVVELEAKNKVIDSLYGLDHEEFYKIPETTLNVPIASDAIVNVKSGPFSNNDFEWCVKSVCQQGEVEYIGKSNLYDF